MTIQAPKNLTKNFVMEFLRKVEKTFEWNGKEVKDIEIDLSKIQTIDILGLLIIYKYIDYTSTHKCFYEPRLWVGKYITSIWSKYEFDQLIQAYLNNNRTDKAFKELKVTFDDRFIIAPQALLRNSNYSNEYLKKEFIPKIEEYYKNKSKVTDLIFSCFSEILLNFWEHAVDDTRSIIIADGNPFVIDIACADTGIGIVSSLKEILNTTKESELLSKAVEKGITSKPNTNHMGFGLWLVNELVKLNNGRLHLYSEGYYYQNNYGKVKSGSCPYWPRTIIFINLNLKNPKTLSDLLPLNAENELKINFTL